MTKENNEVVKQEVFQKQIKQFDEPTNLGELLNFCKVLISSKIMPKEVDTPEKAAVIILTGRELNLPSMAALRSIYVVNGKPALSAQMMLAKAYSTGELENIKIVESGKGESASCSVTIRRKGRSEYTYTFTVEMAKQMQKYANEWLKQPANMCKQLAISGNLRVTFPDAILGMYTPEEIESIVVEEKPTAAELMPKPLKKVESNGDKAAENDAALLKPPPPKTVKPDGEPTPVSEP